MTDAVTFNCAFDIAFEIRGCTDKDGEGVTAKQFRAAILNRLNSLDDEELLEAVGAPFDAHEEVPGESPDALAIQEYLEGGGNHCVNPECQSNNIEGHCVNIDSMVASQEVDCNDCGATWKDLYTLTGIANLDLPNREEE